MLHMKCSRGSLWRVCCPVGTALSLLRQIGKPVPISRKCTVLSHCELRLKPLLLVCAKT